MCVSFPSKGREIGTKVELREIRGFPCKIKPAEGRVLLCLQDLEDEVRALGRHP